MSPASSSARLFIECATAAGCDASQLTCDAEIVARLCGRLDGVPLAIELAASRLSTHSLVELEELIESRLRLAWPGRRTAPLRHQSLSAAMDWSYDLVSLVERSLLQYLSVFPGLFTLDGVRALADGLAERDTVLGILEQLVAKSLVTSRVSAGQARFRLLETTRAYASEKLASSGAAHAANMSHARYVLNALTPRSYEPEGERPGGWLHRSELLADTRASLGWAFSDAGEPSLRMPLAAVGAARLFVEMNLLEECRSWSGRALTIAVSGGDHKAAEIDLLWAFGHASMFSDRNSQECEVALLRGLEMAQGLDDLQNQFRLLSRLHALYRRTGERERLLEVSQLADIVATKLGDPASAGRAHTYLGIAYHLLGDQQAARERLERRRLTPEIPFLPIDHFAYPRGTNVMSCTNLWLIGRSDRAVAVANGLMDARANPDLAMYCAGLCFAARVYRFVGDTESLEEAANRLAGYSRKHGLGPFQTAAQALKGSFMSRAATWTKGVDLLRRSIPRMLAERLELYSGAASLALVEGLAAQGRFDDALASLQVRIDHVASQGESWEMPELLRVRGELRWHTGAEPDVDLLAACELAERQSALSWKLRAVSVVSAWQMLRCGRGGRLICARTYS